MDELMPRRCPFCGTDDVEFSPPLGPDGLSRVVCNECGACGPEALDWHEAVSRWNAAGKRAEALRGACVAALNYIEPYAPIFTDAEEVYRHLRAALAAYDAAMKGEKPQP